MICQIAGLSGSINETPSIPMRIQIFLLFTVLCLRLPITFAQDPASKNPDDPNLMVTAESDFILKDFQFVNGASLPELKVHYRTIGQPVTNRSTGEIQNAVLLLHGTTGTGKEFLEKGFREAMFEPGQPLDASKYYLILPDAIGLGGSSKPSDGLHDRFPHYGYQDMVVGEQRLVTEGLGLKHLRLVFGVSMGGMHAWLWGERYPTFMDAIIPVACQPDKIAGRNLLWRRIITTAIRSDPEWNGGDYHRPPSSLSRVFPIFKLMTSNATQLQQEFSNVEQVNAWLESVAELCRSGQIDANDLVHRLEASADYDPGPDLEKIQASVLAINFADDQLNPPDLRVIDQARPRVRKGQFLLIPASNQTDGHLTLRQGSIYAPWVADFLAKLPLRP